MCKDSDVFALESYVEIILSKGDWKNCSMIKEELSCLNKSIFKEEYLENIMDRLCILFPMKYQKRNNIKSYYKRNYGFIKS